ncbi:hypothetical protein F2S71_27860 [Pseudomonas syringae pv. actinidiae]|nr:hypothetical protein [Pseudomonas syringae pv. actinidiae]
MIEIRISLTNKPDMGPEKKWRHEATGTKKTLKADQIELSRGIVSHEQNTV